MDKHNVDFISKDEAEPKTVKEGKKRSFRIVFTSVIVALLISLLLFFIFEKAQVFFLIPIITGGVIFVMDSDNFPCHW